LAGETEVLGENQPQRHFFHHKSHLTRPWIELGLLELWRERIREETIMVSFVLLSLDFPEKLKKAKRNLSQVADSLAKYTWSSIYDRPHLRPQKKI
jgi:hypothetical protein